LPLNILPVLTSETCQSEIRREGSGYRPDPVRLSRALPGYLDRVGTYYLPVSLLYGLPSFLLTRFPWFIITKSQISEFGYYFGVKNEKIRIRVPIVTLLGSQNNFTGPKPGYVQPQAGPKPHILVDFFNMLWDDKILTEIVMHTNLYTKQLCTRPPQKRHDPHEDCTLDEDDVNHEDQTPIRTNGDQGWIDTDIKEIRA
jgi:hypothetical protein